MKNCKLIVIDKYVDRTQDEIDRDWSEIKKKNDGIKANEPWYRFGPFSSVNPDWQYRVPYRKKSTDYQNLLDGTYQTPPGWRVASATIRDEDIILILESEFDSGPAYR